MEWIKSLRRKKTPKVTPPPVEEESDEEHEDVSVKKQEDGTYHVKIGTHSITLPKDSVEKHRSNAWAKYGTETTYMKYTAHENTITFVKDGKKTVVIDGVEDFDRASDAVMEFLKQWRKAQRGGRSRKLRLNVEGGRTQRHRGSRKHRKLGKLTTRRR